MKTKMMNEKACNYLAMLRETCHLRPDERWILTCLVGRCKASVYHKRPSDVLRNLHDIVGYSNLSPAMAAVCERIRELVESGDQW